MRQYPALYGASRTASRFSASSRKGLDESDVTLREEFAEDIRGEGGCDMWTKHSIHVAADVCAADGTADGVADDTWGQQIAGDAIQDEWSD